MGVQGTAGESCGLDAQLGVVIHRFDPAQRRCRCGQIEVPERQKPQFGGLPIPSRRKVTCHGVPSGAPSRKLPQRPRPRRFPVCVQDRGSELPKRPKPERHPSPVHDTGRAGGVDGTRVSPAAVAQGRSEFLGGGLHDGHDAAAAGAFDSRRAPNAFDGDAREDR